MNCFEIRDFSFVYSGESSPALKNVNLTVKSGEFIAVTGSSGSGKTTLLRMLKPALSPAGETSGEVFFEGMPQASVGERAQAEKIGFVLQKPDNQAVTDKVWHELAFGLESLGVEGTEIRRRTAEIAAFFDIQSLVDKKMSQLSGGQKQLVNLAGVMVMRPSVLLLDEPTGQLDPIAAASLLAAVEKLNREIGTTVIITEHRLEELTGLCSRMLVMDGGEIIYDGKAREVGSYLKERQHPMLLSMPVPVQVHSCVEPDSVCPLSVREGIEWFASYAEGRRNKANAITAKAASATNMEHRSTEVVSTQASSKASAGFAAAQAHRDTYEPSLAKQPCRGAEAKQELASAVTEKTFETVTAAASEKSAPVTVRKEAKARHCIEMRNVHFGYGNSESDVLSGVTLEARPGELLALCGGNGTGKTTLVGVMSGMLKPTRGRVLVADGCRIAVLPQDPQVLFLRSSVRLELLSALDAAGQGKNGKQEKAERAGEVARLCRLGGLLERHPYDLSGGEQQRAAIAKLLLSEPDVLLLDEPTKGLDGESKERLGAILSELCRKGVSVVLVSHDVEFCASHADRCAMLFSGKIVSEGTPEEFFSGNLFYTTAASRMTAGILERAVTAADVITACGCKCFSIDVTESVPSREEVTAEPQSEKNALPLWRRIAAVVCAVMFALFGYLAVRSVDLTELVREGETASAVAANKWLYLGLFLSLALLAVCVGRRERTDSVSPLARHGKAERVNCANDGFYYEAVDASTAQSTIQAIEVARETLHEKEAADSAAQVKSGSRRKKADRRIAGCRRSGRPMSHSAAASVLLVLVSVPLTLLIGERFFAGKRYLIISVMILLETLVPFFLNFEKKRPRARELVLVSSLCALGVAGRALFFALPVFKPVLAVVAVAGACLGSGVGFTVGALTMFVSNMMFGQGPWTPWQMLAMGLVGFFAGCIFFEGGFVRTRASLCVCGAVGAFFLYGGIMNTASVLMFQQNVNAGMLLAAYLTGVPVDLMHALSTVIFLWAGSSQMLEKLERIKVKYGLFPG